MATIFAAFGKFSSNNKGSVQNFGIVGITIASEEITKFIFFFCPCNPLEAKFYGNTFIFGPAAILFVVGYLVNRRTWRLTTGLCNRTQGVGKGCKRVFHFFYIFMNISIKAAIAPSTWLVISLLKGDYYACANWPPADDIVEARLYYNLQASNKSLPLPCMFKSPTLFNPSSEASIIARDLRATSHLIGWWFLAIALMSGVLVMFALRCGSKYSYEQSKYIERYRSHEVSLFEETLDAKAKEQAQRIVDGYFVKPRKKEEWDQIAVINDKVTKSKRGRPIYSPMHKFVNRELMLQAEENGTALDYGLVGDAAEKKRSAKKTAAKLAAANKQAPGGGDVTGVQMMPMVAIGGKKNVVKQAKPVPTNDQSSVLQSQDFSQPRQTAPTADTDPKEVSIGTSPMAVSEGNQTGDMIPPDPIKETNLLDPEDSSTDEEDEGDGGNIRETMESPDANNITEDYSTNDNNATDHEPLLS